MITRKPEHLKSFFLLKARHPIQIAEGSSHGRSSSRASTFKKCSGSGCGSDTDLNGHYAARNPHSRWPDTFSRIPSGQGWWNGLRIMRSSDRASIALTKSLQRWSGGPAKAGHYVHRLRTQTIKFPSLCLCGPWLVRLKPDATTETTRGPAEAGRYDGFLVSPLRPLSLESSLRPVRGARA